LSFISAPIGSRDQFVADLAEISNRIGALFFRVFISGHTINNSGLFGEEIEELFECMEWKDRW
jgi:hypothetical protein